MINALLAAALSLTISHAHSQAINTWKPLKPGKHQVVVAVIDSGHIYGHPSLSGQELEGYNFATFNHWPDKPMRGRDVTPDEDESCQRITEVKGDLQHGLQVSSIIAGNGEHGIHGVHPGAKILPIKVIGRCGMARQDLIDAMRWAAGLEVNDAPINHHPAKVINVSVIGGHTMCSSALQQAINEITSLGIFVVAAAGNTGGSMLREPANCNGVISVGATLKSGAIADYSSRDENVVIFAPGGIKRHSSSAAEKYRAASFYRAGFITKKLHPSFSQVAGTSFSAPMVSGYISLWLSRQPDLTPRAFIASRELFSSYISHTGWVMSGLVEPPMINVAAYEAAYMARHQSSVKTLLDEATSLANAQSKSSAPSEEYWLVREVR